jgi:hypothetical protein
MFATWMLKTLVFTTRVFPTIPVTLQGNIQQPIVVVNDSSDDNDNDNGLAWDPSLRPLAELQRKRKLADAIILAFRKVRRLFGARAAVDHLRRSTPTSSTSGQRRLRDHVFFSTRQLYEGRRTFGSFPCRLLTRIMHSCSILELVST